MVLKPSIAIKTGANIAIVVLAAGEGSRMKSIKQLLPWKGTPLVRHCLATMKQVGPTDIFLVLGAHYNTIMETCPVIAEESMVLYNPDWQKGLSTSIILGLRHIIATKRSYDGVLICLADQPLFTPRYFKEMLALFNKDQKAMVATQYGPRPGVPALFNREHMAKLLTLKGDHGARQIMDTYKDHLITMDPGKMYQDLDTPQEYEYLYEKYSSNENDEDQKPAL